MPINPVLALAPAITFHPEPATRAALARMANVEELSLTGLLNKLITGVDSAVQHKLACLGENEAFDGDHARACAKRTRPDRPAGRVRPNRQPTTD